MSVDAAIETPRVILRRFKPADTPKVFLMSQEVGMRTWIPSLVYRDEDHTAERLGDLISYYDTVGDPRQEPFVLGVELRESGELVGHVGLSPFEGEVEIGYAIETACQRRGLAVEASRAMCQWATVEFSLETILGVAAGGNLASQQVLRRSGFVHREDRFMRLQGQDQMAVIYEYADHLNSAGGPRTVTPETRRP